MAKTTIDQTLTLELTTQEVDAVHALAHGICALRERAVTDSAAVVAAVELGLVRLLDDYDLSEDDRAVVERGLDAKRAAWARGNCCL